MHIVHLFVGCLQRLGIGEYCGYVLVCWEMCDCAIFPPTRTDLFKVMMQLKQSRP